MHKISELNGSTRPGSGPNTRTPRANRAARNPDNNDTQERPASPNRRHTREPIPHGDTTSPELTSLRTQNTRLRSQLAEVDQHFDDQRQDWQTERDRLRGYIAELRQLLDTRTHSLRAISRQLATSNRHLETERTHLRAIAQHIRHIDVNGDDSDDSDNVLLDNEPLPKRRRFR